MTHHTCQMQQNAILDIFFLLTTANLSKIKIKKGKTFKTKTSFVPSIISFCVHTILFSAGPLKFDIRPRGVFIILRQLSAIIRQGCFYRNSAKTRGAYISKSVCVFVCRYIRSRLMRFRGTVRKEKERKRKENTASVRCTHSRVIDYATSRDIILSNR